MPIVVLIPAVLFLIALFLEPLEAAFADIYLPLFLLCPIYYFWKVPSLPPIDVAQAVLVPLGLAIVANEYRRWRFSWMDVAIGMFIFSAWYAEVLAGHSTGSTFALFNGMTEALVPYLAGKLLMEKDQLRDRFVKRIVFLLFVASVISIYEFRLETNPFMAVFSRFFPEESFAWKTQIRWGFGRVSGPYGQSELAGMMLFAGLALALYLGYNKLWEPKFRYAQWLPGTKSRWILTVIALTLYMTQARGPWLGCLVALPVAMIGRSRRVLRTAILTGVVLAVLGTVAYVGLHLYTSAPTVSDEQQTATYRAQLLVNYMPIAIEGGPWGWGALFPQVFGQGSIDNEYLFVSLTEGWVGLLSLVTLAVLAIFHLVMATITNREKKDRYFAFTLLGILLGLLVTIYTVYLGNQPYQLFFLVAGWAHAVHVGQQQQKVARPAYAFKQVYTSVQG